jgi:hypothetical protein
MPGRFTIVAATSFLLLFVTAALWFDSINTIRYLTYGMKGASRWGQDRNLDTHRSGCGGAPAGGFMLTRCRAKNGLTPGGTLIARENSHSLASASITFRRSRRGMWMCPTGFYRRRSRWLR